jgi:hypothetical protein
MKDCVADEADLSERYKEVDISDLLLEWVSTKLTP